MYWLRNGHLLPLPILTAFSDPCRKGDTPLHEAAKRGFPDIVSALLKAGADRDARNNQGESASDIACREPKKISKESCVTLIKAALKTKSNLKAKNTVSFQFLLNDANPIIHTSSPFLKSTLLSLRMSATHVFLCILMSFHFSEMLRSL